MRGKRIFLEFPAYSLGPASTALQLVPTLRNHGSVVLVSDGVSLAYARARYSSLEFARIDTTRHSARWDSLLASSDPNALFLSCCNPPFAKYAIAKRRTVGRLDILDWLWPKDYRPRAEDAAFQILQAFFGQTPVEAAPRTRYCQPLIDMSRWQGTRRSPDPFSALISFSGLSFPGLEIHLARYVNLVLKATITALRSVGVRRFTIVAGNALKHWRSVEGVTVLSALQPAAYHALFERHQHILLTPGLTSIYECGAARLPVLFLPGFNVSQVHQTDWLMQFHHPWVCQWPQSAELEKVRAYESDMEAVTAIRNILKLEAKGGRHSLSAKIIAAEVESYVSRQVEKLSYSYLDSVYAHPPAEVALDDILAGF